MIDKRQLTPAKPFFVQGKQVSEEFKMGDAERGWLFIVVFFSPHSAKVGLCFSLCTFKVRINIVYTELFMMINGEGKDLKSIMSKTLPDLIAQSAAK